MYTKVLAFVILATAANGNDLIVGLKTDGTKFFDENRQANPALWRQMDNVTIKAPENEVIRRVVITDLRPDKDGDVKIVEGGEGQKNVTIELKSPTVLRGYEFHIEVYSTPQENVPFTNDQQSTTEMVTDASSTTSSKNPTTNLDTTSNLPGVSTDKIVPAILSEDEVKDNERQGRNIKNNMSERTTEITSTTFTSGISTTPTTQITESSTENHSETTSATPNKFEPSSTITSIPLNRNFNTNPIIPAISGADIANDKTNVNGDDETRHVRDTEKEKSGKPTESSSETDKKVSTTEITHVIPVEEKSQDTGKKDDTAAPMLHTFDNHKYTSAISSKVEHPNSPIEAKDDFKPRNVRGTNEEINTDENISTTPSDITTTDVSEITSTPSDDCVTTETANIQNPTNIGKDNIEDKADPIPIYLNNRQFNQRFNNPTFQTDNQSSPDLKVNQRF